MPYYYKQAFLFFFLLLNSSGVFADLPEQKPSARAAAMGNLGVSQTDGWSVFHNQAGLPFAGGIWIGAHHENRFVSPDLNFSALGVVLPVWNGAFGFSVKRLGFSSFSQNKLGISYGMKLAPRFSAGVQVNAHHIFIEGEYGQTTAFSAEGGIMYNPTQNLTIGLHIINPTRSKIYESERIPTLLNLGVSYKLGETLLISTGAEKNIETKPSLKVGVEFEPIQSLFFRTGFSTEPNNIGFGIGYHYNTLFLDLAFTKHQFLGYTPHVSLSYTFGKESKPKPDTLQP